MRNSAVLLNYFFFLLSLGAEIPKTDVRAKRSMKFEDVRPGKKVRNDAVIKTIIFLKLCHLACARHARCRSYTICGGPHVCQLKREDVFSTDLGEGILVDDATCKYFGLSRNEVPTCVDAGTFVDIKNDNRRGVCGINGKRVDHQWSTWEEIVELNSSTKFKTRKSRKEVLIPAHGGKTGSEVSEIPLQWVKWVRQNKNWEDARANCNQMGEDLFYKLNGTSPQLDWLASKVDGATAWLGGYKVDHAQCERADGQTFRPSDLIWLTGQPSGGNENHMNLRFGRINDAVKSFRSDSICDLFL